MALRVQDFRCTKTTQEVHTPCRVHDDGGGKFISVLIQYSTGASRMPLEWLRDPGGWQCASMHRLLYQSTSPFLLSCTGGCMYGL